MWWKNSDIVGRYRQLSTVLEAWSNAASLEELEYEYAQGLQAMVADQGSRLRPLVRRIEWYQRTDRRFPDAQRLQRGSFLSRSSGNTSPVSTPAASSTGTAMATLTDAPGDFLTYLVQVVSLKLTRADGTVVETVPNSTQIDFTQLVNLSEIISAQQVPSGTYVSAALTLDYSGASIIVDNGNGGVTVPASNIINGSTNAALVAPASQLTVTLQLPSGAPLVINRGVIANLALDFNLAASNTVAPSSITASTAPSGVTVTVNPTLTASIAPDASKQIRVRGPLVSVTNTASATSYTVNVRPFFNASGEQGQIVVNTTATTSFVINGTTSTGSAGLTALAARRHGHISNSCHRRIRCGQRHLHRHLGSGRQQHGGRIDGWC